MRVSARFSEPDGGLGLVRLELIQGDREEPLGERVVARAGAFSPLRGTVTPELTIEATVGTSTHAWLAEGDAVIRATADRMAGFLRSPAATVVERRLPVRRGSPLLEVTSGVRSVRQGGTGATALRVGDHVVRSGVRAGRWESRSFPRPGAPTTDRVVLFAVPWDLTEHAAIVAFAEDDAGNTTERRFVDELVRAPGRSAAVELSDAFLARVVAQLAAQEPSLDLRGELIDRFVRINSELRRSNLAQVEALAAGSGERFLAAGAFRQMPATALQAGFAERREYRHRGKVVDRQVHLGLDLASTARAQVPAAQTGTVAFAGPLGIYGNAVVLDHGLGVMSLYGHLSEVEVAVGSPVRAGDTLGLSGATGLAGGDHLHFETLVGGHSVNPIEWLDARWFATAIAGPLGLGDD